jgi:uncharacterized membrane protein
VILFLSGLAFYLLQILIVKFNVEDSRLKEAIGANFKGQISLVVYLLSFAISFFAPKVSVVLFGLVALMWIVPDRRLESYSNQA